MHRFYLPFLLLMTIVVEGVATDLLPRSVMAQEWMIIPHWLLVFLVLITVFFDLEDTYFSVLYAILFGLMIDIVYTSVIGVYMFIYAIVIYIIHGLRKMLHANFFVALSLTILAILLADSGLYIIYFFIGISPLLWDEYIVTRLLPTLVANIAFFALLYPFTKNRLVHWSLQQFDYKK
ncbi:rod shape-determining protein MreD [Aquibacillus salsiterrae]|uniref:Rod shape-determining protein MreD n=1 Tax=Aquibacillus salsiterrae TaxID=2950439 RepID=A0A9X3WDX7_9BACI|nr:rod shape-determining protein MreD [Aquibacillus salsiterrae]MDC3415669.1 rod shape-determining protein MreD [Aquibacillus salsiterrae]